MRDIDHDRDADAEGHLLFDGKFSPVISANSVAPVYHYCVVRTSFSALKVAM